VEKTLPNLSSLSPRSILWVYYHKPTGKVEERVEGEALIFSKLTIDFRSGQPHGLGISFGALVLFFAGEIKRAL
jgi:hypothetical protein